MKRRSFLQALGATALVTPLLSNSEPSDEVIKFTYDYDGGPEACADEALRNPRILYVTTSYASAVEVLKRMKHREAVTVVAPGGMLCGIGVDYLIMDDEVDLEDPRVMAWYHEAVLPRKVPGAKQANVLWRHNAFDYDRLRAVEGRFTDLEEARYDVNALRWPTANDSASIRYNAQAQLLDWYIESRKWL